MCLADTMSNTRAVRPAAIFVDTFADKYNLQDLKKHIKDEKLNPQHFPKDVLEKYVTWKVAYDKAETKRRSRESYVNNGGSEGKVKKPRIAEIEEDDPEEVSRRRDQGRILQQVRNLSRKPENAGKSRAELKEEVMKTLKPREGNEKLKPGPTKRAPSPTQPKAASRPGAKPRMSSQLAEYLKRRPDITPVPQTAEEFRIKFPEQHKAYKLYLSRPHDARRVDKS